MLAVEILSFLLGIVAIVATAMPLIKKESWWIRIFDFPRLQIFCLGLLSLALIPFFWSGHWAEITLAVGIVVALGVQAVAIFPYTPLAKKQAVDCRDPGSHPVFSLMVMNVHMYNRNAEKAREIVEKAKPDILIAVETDHWWRHQFQYLEEDFPYRFSIPLENTYGMLLYSRLKLIRAKAKYLVMDDVPSIHARVSLAGGGEFRLYAVHPRPPAPGHDDSSVHRDAELVIIGKLTRQTSEPSIVAGDLNDVAWSHTTRLFQRFSELLDPRIGRGMFNTFHAKYPLLRWPLDHIFHTGHFQILDIKRLSYFGSDHFPIYVKLCYMPSMRHRQEEPKASREDAARARDKIVRSKTK